MTDFEAIAAMANGLALTFIVMFAINVITVIIIFIWKEAKIREVCLAVLYFYASGYLFLFFVLWQLLNLYGYTVATLNRVSYSSINDHMFSLLRITSYECRVKFVCEASRLVMLNNDALASILRFASAALVRFDGDYVSGALEGLTGSDCQQVYATCPYSPLENTFPFLLESR